MVPERACLPRARRVGFSAAHGCQIFPQLTLHDRLSRLTVQQAEKWLGPEGKRLLAEAGRTALDIDPSDASWPDDATFQVLLHAAGREPVVVTLARDAAGRDGVRWHCSERDGAP